MTRLGWSGLGLLALATICLFVGPLQVATLLAGIGSMLFAERHHGDRVREVLHMEAGKALRSSVPLPLPDAVLWYAGCALMFLSLFLG